MKVKDILLKGTYYGFITVLWMILIFMIGSLFIENFDDLFLSINTVSYKLTEQIFNLLKLNGELWPVMGLFLGFPILLIYYVLFAQVVLSIYTIIKEKKIFFDSKNLKPFNQGVLVGFIVGIVKSVILTLTLAIKFISISDLNEFFLKYFSSLIIGYFQHNSIKLFVLWLIDIFIIITSFSIMGGIIGFVINKMKK